MKKLLMSFVIILLILICSSCALLRSQLDKNSNFSVFLKAVENNIRADNWTEAKQNLAKSIKAWYSIKPYLQVDIDHDYVNDIEADFTRLRANLETNQKPSSLEYILLIQNNWEKIGSM